MFSVISETCGIRAVYQVTRAQCQLRLQTGVQTPAQTVVTCLSARIMQVLLYITNKQSLIFCIKVYRFAQLSSTFQPSSERTCQQPVGTAAPANGRRWCNILELKGKQGCCASII